MLEPIGLKKPVCVGPYTANFKQEVDLLYFHHCASAEGACSGTCRLQFSAEPIALLLRRTQQAAECCRGQSTGSAINKSCLDGFAGRRGGFSRGARFSFRPLFRPPLSENTERVSEARPKAGATS